MLVICQRCRLRDTDKTQMVKTNRGYYHPKCHEEFEKERKRRQKELEEWDKLYQYILEIYRLDVIPQSFITRLQDLRNGTIRKGEYAIERYKKGVPYWAILRAYEKSRPKIEQSLRTKDYQGSVTRMLNYGYSIMVDKLNEVRSEVQAKKRAKQMAKATQNFDVDVIENDTRKRKIKKERYNKDISDLL